MSDEPKATDEQRKGGDRRQAEDDGYRGPERRQGDRRREKPAKP